MSFTCRELGRASPIPGYDLVPGRPLQLHAFPVEKEPLLRVELKPSESQRILDHIHRARPVQQGRPDAVEVGSVGRPEQRVGDPATILHDLLRFTWRNPYSR